MNNVEEQETPRHTDECNERVSRGYSVGMYMVNTTPD